MLANFRVCVLSHSVATGKSAEVITDSSDMVVTRLSHLFYKYVIECVDKEALNGGAWMMLGRA